MILSALGRGCKLRKAAPILWGPPRGSLDQGTRTGTGPLEYQFLLAMQLTTIRLHSPRREAISPSRPSVLLLLAPWVS